MHIFLFHFILISMKHLSRFRGSLYGITRLDEQWSRGMDFSIRTIAATGLLFLAYDNDNDLFIVKACVDSTLLSDD